MSTIEHKLVVVDSDGKDYGCTMFWEGAHASLADVEANAGLLPDGVKPPEAPSPVAALARAMQSLAGVTDTASGVLSRPFGKARAHGRRALVREVAEGETLSYTVGARAWTERVEGVGDAEATYTLHVADATPDEEARIRDHYARALTDLTPVDLSSWLVRSVLPALDGVALRRQGGFYYTPPQAKAKVAAVASFVSQVFRGAVVHKLPTMRSEEAVAAVTAAIVQEIQDLCLDFAEKSADGKYGKRALKAREEDLAAAKAKLARYESLLDAALPAVHAQIEEVTGAICAAQLAEMATAAE